MIFLGCDIHAHVIIRRPIYRSITRKDGHVEYQVVDHNWKLVNNWRKNGCYDPSLPDDGFDNTPFQPAECFMGRDYTLFGVLAGVRSNEYDPIDSPRGLPLGCPKELEDYIDKAWGDSAHSRSWLSLAELNRAVRNKKKYPKWETFVDEYGRKAKSKDFYGPHVALKEFRDCVRTFANADCYYDDPEDVRVVFFFDS